MRFLEMLSTVLYADVDAGCIKQQQGSFSGVRNAEKVHISNAKDTSSTSSDMRRTDLVLIKRELQSKYLSNARDRSRPT